MVCAIVARRLSSVAVARASIFSLPFCSHRLRYTRQSPTAWTTVNRERYRTLRASRIGCHTRFIERASYEPGLDRNTRNGLDPFGVCPHSCAAGQSLVPNTRWAVVLRGCLGGPRFGPERTVRYRRR